MASGGRSPSPAAAQPWPLGSVAAVASPSDRSTTPPGNAWAPGKAMLPWRSSISTEKAAPRSSRIRITVLDGRGSAGPSGTEGRLRTAHEAPEHSGSPPRGNGDGAGQQAARPAGDGLALPPVGGHRGAG